ncbi:alpha-L-fucosidase [Mucilaginibacter paludis]|uniref:alpha-L-fucosidase n=1 Tax=Mucilaginibacter paludis DSM 18603 TaxID=714943 RepID=H1Y6E7_9SPHI|nr:alpha-L-fucosidase [Mucilaginibacter paludis]EHQ25791.1 coagulation factor 5/8 type domain protein [Mucilaginibacter paludis DSM 18603]
MKNQSKLILLLLCLLPSFLMAQNGNTPVKPLTELQQNFVDLRFGMFIHFNMPTYANQDWPDPEMPASAFNPTKLNCDQWAKAAKTANMAYGCITTKHHSGFCIWDTKTTDYNVMNSPLKRDVVKEYVDAFRKNGLKVFLYYSILDTHHYLRPNCITPQHSKMVKAQLTELLTHYGPIQALIIDGWDAPWSRISYDDIPFEEIYRLVKSLQPNCLLMDLNGAKYPQEALYYTDIKTYEMGAGQRIASSGNRLPSLACLPLQQNWFWETSHPTTPVKDPVKLVNETLIPLNKENCNFILNVAPNRDGLMDDNALAALKQIGELWHNQGPLPPLPNSGLPIISHNLAKHVPANSSWSDDSAIMDFANDDDFGTSWVSNSTIKKPWFELNFKNDTEFNTITIAEEKANIKSYTLSCYHNGAWITLFSGENTNKIKIHRLKQMTGSKIRMQIESYDHQPSIAEFGVYNERR